MKYLHIPPFYPDSEPACVRVPVNGPELQKALGKKNLIHKFSRKLSTHEIERAAPAIIAKYLDQVDDGAFKSRSDQTLALVDKAARLLTMEDFLDRWEASTIKALQGRQQLEQFMDSPFGDGTITLPTDADPDAEPVEAIPAQLFVPPVVAQPVSNRRVYQWEQIIPVWVVERKKINKLTSEDDKKDARRYLDRLFGFLGHDDMNAVTGSDIERYATENLLAEDSNLGPGGYRDHALRVKAFFKLAFRLGKIDQNPCDGRLSYAKNTGKRERWDDQQFKLIMLSARECINPVIRLPLLVEGMTGCRASEFVESNPLTDFRWVKGELRFDIRIAHRTGDERRLKSGDKTERFTVIHRSIRDTVWAHIQERRKLNSPRMFDLPQYGGRSGKAATNQIGRWLDKLDGLNQQDNQSAHSLRHNVTTALDGLAERRQITEALAEWLTHPPSTVRRKTYIHREVEEVSAAIHMLPNPFADEPSGDELASAEGGYIGEADAEAAD